MFIPSLVTLNGIQQVRNQKDASERISPHSLTVRTVYPIINSFK